MQDLSRGPEPTKYLFIDGAYLDQVLTRISSRFVNGAPLDLNFDRVADGARKVFYYDCLPGKKENESDADFKERLVDRQEYFDMLREQRGWHVQLGTVKGEGGKLRQKQVDTLLSVDMLAHSYRRNASQIGLIAGDLDFKPAVDALVQDGMYVTLYFDKSHVSKELRNAADDRRQINVHSVQNWFTPEFRKLVSLPLVESSPDDRVVGHSRVREGKLVDARKVSLFRSPQGAFAAVFDEGNNPGYRTYVKHASAEVVEKFVEDVYSEIIWA